MSRAQLNNPWKVESIQDFLCLKCPECVFFTQDENDFENHAVSNHPLSAMLFDGTMSSSEIDYAEKEEVLGNVFNDVKVHNFKKEPADLDTSELRDPFDFSNTNIQRQGTHFMSSLAEPDSLYNKYSLHPRNKAKKLKIEPRSGYSSPHTSAFLENDQEYQYHYQCEDCGARFYSEEGLEDFKNHWQIKHCSDSTDIQHDFPCSLCDFSTKDETDFKTHIEVDHSKNDGKIKVCSKCDFKDDNILKFNNHLKIHKHYQCLGCENNFHGSSSKAAFKMHLETVQSANQETNSKKLGNLLRGINNFSSI